MWCEIRSVLVRDSEMWRVFDTRECVYRYRPVREKG